MPTSSSSRSILIIGRDTEELLNLQVALSERAFFTFIASDPSTGFEQIEKEPPDMLLIDQSVIARNHSFRDLVDRGVVPTQVPAILILSPVSLKSTDGIPHADDFIIRPFTIDELAARIEHSLQRRHALTDENLIQCDALTIDLERCQVFIANHRVSLTYKEYELLKLLATSGGKVFTRQDLLDHIWGQDYHAGNRTVDVHIRRLRSKIEDADHSFVETVRNVGYRLKTDV